MALDLTQQVPRSPFDELEGYPWLPRMIDKAQAYYAGTHGDYSTYPCPGDKKFLGHFKLDAEAIGKLIQAGESEAAIAAYVKQHAEGDLEAYRSGMRNPPTDLGNRLLTFVFRAIMKKKIMSRFPDLDYNKLDTLPKVLAAEEGHPVPGL